MAKPRHRLKALREKRALTQEALAQAVGVAVTTYRDWEQGRRSPYPGHRGRLAKHLRVSLDEVADLLDEAASLNGHEVPEWLGHFASLEQGAAKLRIFEPVVVPGLLQIGRYAAAVERTVPGPVHDSDVERKVETRLARQRVLAREPRPLELQALVDESALHRVTGGLDVMATQLEHLAEMIELPNVDLRVLPLDERVHCSASGAFQLLTAPGANRSYMACTEDLTGVRYHEGRHAVETHSAMFEHLHALALTPGESIDLIRTVAKEKYE